MKVLADGLVDILIWSGGRWGEILVGLLRLKITTRNLGLDLSVQILQNSSNRSEYRG